MIIPPSPSHSLSFTQKSALKKLNVNRTAELEKLLETEHLKIQNKKGIENSVLGVMSGSGDFKWIGAKGKANSSGVEITTNTPFFIASVTKLFITASVLRLVEQGKVKLGKPAADYLPEGLMSGIHRYRDRDYSSEISVMHLLTHSSGIPDWLEDRPKGGKSMVDQIVLEEDRLISIPELVEAVKNSLQSHFPPSDLEGKKIRIRYSDTNFQLLIALLEHCCEKPISSVFEELIYRPLGLSSTFHPGQDGAESIERADFWVAKKPFDRPALIQSFRDLYSTADDLLLFFRAMISGDLFEDPKTVEWLGKKWNRFSFPLDSVAFRLPSWPIQYGVGMMRWELPRIYSPFRRIPPVVGHTGVTGSWLFYCETYDLYLCGTVSQLYQAPLPFQWVPQLLAKIEKLTV